MPVSSKALLLFAEGERGLGFAPRDPARLLSVLPIHVARTVFAYVTWWSWTGLAL